MTYIRKMKDGSEKVYYTSSEMKEKLHKSILNLGNELINEIKEERLNKQNYIKNKNVLIYNQNNLCIV
ncbi:MAG: hypothetical protein Q9M94_03570 [Candidatus Gracilibacteria bacterium]|nr:hypothetical protein [Candidatus Gracilibacteria bacterium]MDQ7021940.1 hypothetical protein [Candidatus Gracilibacteria bacterium]